MSEDGARGKDWLRALGASPVSYRHNFLVTRRLEKMNRRVPKHNCIEDFYGKSTIIEIFQLKLQNITAWIR